MTEPDGRPGEWYLHLFAAEQPDLDWTHPEVRADFEKTLAFWFDRGVDGFRIDVAHSLVKQEGLPDVGTGTPPELLTDAPAWPPGEHPHWDREEVHEVYREWRAVADSYDEPRVFVAEAWVDGPERLARYVRPDELHTAFAFDFLVSPWRAPALRQAIDTTWWSTPRSARRPPGCCPTTTPSGRSPGTPGSQADGPHLHPAPPDRPAGGPRPPAPAGPGPRRCSCSRCPAARTSTRATSSACRRSRTCPRRRCRTRSGPGPGTPGAAGTAAGCRCRGRPAARRTASARPGRAPWLPQPPGWDRLAVAVQDGDPASTLELHRAALRLRRSHPALGDGTLRWQDAPAGVLAFARDPGFGCLVNLSDRPVPLPAGTRLLLASCPLAGAALPPDTTAWLDLGEAT